MVDDRKKTWITILVLFFIMGIIDFYIGYNYYDKDAMCMLAFPLEVLFYTLIAIQFLRLEKQVWIVVFLLMIMIKDATLFSLYDIFPPPGGYSTDEKLPLLDILFVLAGKAIVFGGIGFIMASAGNALSKIKIGKK